MYNGFGDTEVSFNLYLCYALRKLAHAIYRFFFQLQKLKILIAKELDIFNTFTQNIDCGR